MNMGFHKSLGAELEHLRRSSDGLASDEGPASRPNRLKQLMWLLVAAAVAYFLTTLSATLLWALLAVAVAVIALATAVCIYAQNNSW